MSPHSDLRPKLYNLVKRTEENWFVLFVGATLVKGLDVGRKVAWNEAANRPACPVESIFGDLWEEL